MLAGSGGTPPDQRSNSGEITTISAGSGEQSLPSGNERESSFYPAATPAATIKRVTDTRCIDPIHTEKSLYRSPEFPSFAFE